MKRSLLVLCIGASACASTRGDLEDARRARDAALADRAYAARRVKQIRRGFDRDDAYREQRRRELRRELRAKVVPKRDVVVAVFGVEDHDGMLVEADRRTLSRYLASAVLEKTHHRIVPPDRLRAALIDEKAESYRPCYDEGCQIELGRRLAADRTLEADVFERDGRCQLGVTVYDLKTETTTWAESVEGDCSMNALFDSADDLTRALAKHDGSRS